MKEGRIMFRIGKVLLIVAAVLALTGPVLASRDKGVITGMVIGRTGEILHISVPEPVREGAIMEVRPIECEPPVAEIRVLSCTHEAPYVALAKVIRCNADPVATGVRTYGELKAVAETNAPKPMSTESIGNDGRLSIQVGAFQPSSAYMKDVFADYWQEYRLNYEFLRYGTFGMQLSAEYTKGIGKVASNNGTINRTMEIMPAVLLGRLRPLRMGRTTMFVGAGAGWYTIRTTDVIGGLSTTDTQRKVGREYSAGFEHSQGWIVELRYRDIPATYIKGYSLALGGRF